MAGIPGRNQMKILSSKDIPGIYESLRNSLMSGSVGIFPTDTLYGLTGNALDEDVVERILRIKRRRSPFSIIPHSLQWVEEIIDQSQISLFEACAEQFSGKYSMLFRYSGSGLPEPLHSTGLVSLRIPHHWISDFARFAGIPLVTTSVNVHDEAPISSIDDLSEDLLEDIDFAIDEGPLPGPPSALVHCYDGKPFRIERRSPGREKI